MNKALLLAALLVFLSACAAFPTGLKPPAHVACTEEAKICPDGTAVGRIAPDCDFAPCPKEGKVYCESDDDCICGGIDPETGNCFVGNRNYYDVFVNKEQDCPDFCTGIDGRMQTRCMRNKCALVRGEPPEVAPWISIAAEPSRGEVPLSVHFIARLHGTILKGYACAKQNWTFADGKEYVLIPECDIRQVTEFPTTYEVLHHYELPGLYNATFSLGNLTTAFYSIIVLPESLPPECDEASDCAPAQCCHAADCVIVEKRPYCNDVFCTQVCLPGTMDCGGSCACVAGRCTGQGFYTGAAPTGKVPWQSLS